MTDNPNPLTPTPKVAAGFAGGAVTTIIIGILHRCKIDLSPDEAAAITTLVGLIASYFAPRSKPTREQIAEIPASKIAEIHPSLCEPTQ